MGLFGGKKDKEKIADYFSAEELQHIRDTVGPKLEANEYGALPQLLAKGLMDYVNRPEKEFSPGKINGFMKIAASMKDIEPSLEGILQRAIDKFNA